MKFLLFPVFFIATLLNSSPPKSNELTIERIYKVIGTFSGDVNTGDSFHLIIAKNNKTKKHEIIPIAYKETSFKRLNAISFETQPSVVSFHSNGENVSIIISQKVKKATSYVSKDKLFQLILNKQKAVFSITKIADNQQTKLDLNNQNITNRSGSSISLEDFLKSATKSKNEPTITVNETKSGNVVVRGDYVNKNEYRYNYNWWWWHQWQWQNQMMWQQQQMMNQMRVSVPRSFGPSQPIYEYYFKPKERHYFEIVLTPDNELNNASEVETIYLMIDKKVND